MASELTPTGGKVKMTRSQVRKYIINMKNAQAIAQAKLNEAKKNGDFEKEEEELKRLENLLDNI